MKNMKKASLKLEQIRVEVQARPKAHALRVRTGLKARGGGEFVVTAQRSGRP